MQELNIDPSNMCMVSGIGCSARISGYVDFHSMHTMHGRAPGEYVATVSFGEYASPSFDNLVETVGKARLQGIMSIEQAVEELYGDSWTDEQKGEEVLRLKAEQGMIEVEEPAVKDDLDDLGEGDEE